MKNIHVLKTDKPSRLYIGDNQNFVFGMIQTSIQSRNDYFTNQHIYITSDEEIKEGDWFLHPFNTLHKAGGNLIDKDFRKIILTTDQDLIKDGVQAIDDEFLEWFLKNPSCEEVEVIKTFEDYTIVGGKSDEIYYKIIIPKEEPKQITSLDGDGLGGMPKGILTMLIGKKEETPKKHIKYINDNIEEFDSKVKEFNKEQKQHLIDMMKADEELGLYEEPKTDYSFFIKQKEEEFKNFLKKREATPEEVAEYLGFVKGAKYQQEQDKNKYSEEDLIDAFNEGQALNVRGKLIQGKEWFEQFKKK